MTKKILIIAPHLDDDALSFGGYMIDELEKGSEIYIRIGTIGGKHILQDFHKRQDEFREAVKFLGIPWFNCSYFFHNKDAEMDTIPIREIASKIDRALDDIKPDEVFCSASSTHQDHKALFDAFSISMRLRDGYIAPFVALGEYPFSLTHYEIPNGGKFYHPLSNETLQKKIEYFNIYKSQIKPSPSPLNEVGITTLARTRGLECGHEFAELFYIQRMIK